MEHGDLIRIRWLDSVSDVRVWIDEDEFNFDSNDKGMEYESVGYFIRETKVAIYLCQSMRIHEDDGGSNLGHLLSIPNKAILSIKIIKSA